MSRCFVSMTCFVAWMSACAMDVELPDDVDSIAGYIEAGSADEATVLALVNDRSVSEADMDIAANLDRRAARGIVTFRNGADGVEGTTDDRDFVSIDQLDAVPYVGVTALTRLLDYALSNGYGAEPAGPTASREDVILAVANDTAVTFTVLDDLVRLDRRAAQRIVDNRPFSTLDALDAVPYVGNSALARLYEYGLANGYGGGPPDDAPQVCGGRSNGACPVGSFCAFSLSASCGRGDRTGVCAPIPEVCTQQLDPVCGCNGLSFSNSCRANAAGVAVDHAGVCVAPDGGRCNEVTRCSAGLVCEGIAGIGVERYGFCRSGAQVPGFWDDCGSDSDCNTGLECFGLATGASQGFCGDEWAHRSFSSEETVSIPDNNTSGARSTIVARGLATAEMDVWVSLDIRHSYRGDLRVTLLSPANEVVFVWQGEADDSASNLLLQRQALAVPGDGSANGAWILQVEDRAAEDQGTLRGWSLELTSRWD